MALDSAGRYCLLKVLHGNAMDVDTLLKVFDRHLGKVVAVKRLRLDKRGPVPCAILRKYLQTELLTHRSLVHPNIAQLRDAFISQTDGQISFNVVMDYANAGDLAGYIQDYAHTFDQHLPEDVVRQLFKQLMMAVHFMHGQKVAHRHLKPEHVLVHYETNQTEMVPVLKLCDFGMSKHLSRAITNTAVGLPHYMPPEIMQGLNHLGPEIDMWCAGICLFVMAAGNYPFEDPSSGVPTPQAWLWRRNQSTWEHDLPPHCSSGLRGLLKKLLDPSPLTRMTMQQLLADPWFQDAWSSAAARDADFPQQQGAAADSPCEKDADQLKALTDQVLLLLPDQQQVGGAVPAAAAAPAAVPAASLAPSALSAAASCTAAGTSAQQHGYSFS